jgi:hypothetical protein
MNEYNGSYSLTANSSIVLYPDANGVYTYFSASGNPGQINAASLINKDLFVSFFGFDENIWNLDDIDVERNLYPNIRNDI